MSIPSQSSGAGHSGDSSLHIRILVDTIYFQDETANRMVTQLTNSSENRQDGSRNHNGECDDVSLIYSMLPLLVRRSVPKVRSLRRSISGYSSIQTRSSSIDSSGSGSKTPPPAYHDPLLPLSSSTDNNEGKFGFNDFAASPTGPHTFSDNGRSGIRWKYASQGKIQWMK